MPIKNLPSHLRPQEKALMHGIESLSEIELLALILRSGSRNSDALQLASLLLQQFGSFDALVNAPYETLRKVKGVGKVKALQLKAFYLLDTLGKDRVLSKQEEGPAVIDSVIDFVARQVPSFSQENFLVVLLNMRNHIVGFRKMYIGTKGSVIFSPNEVVTYVANKNVRRFYCLHNHPSGDLAPSAQDVQATKEIASLAKLLDLKFMGHMIFNAKHDYQLISW